MNYNISSKIIDYFILFMLVMSSGGLLFVFNRNVSSIIFFIILSGIIFFGRNLKKSLVISSFLSLIVIVFLGIINYNFAISEQTLNKYLFYFLTTVISILILVHFYNNRSKEVFLLRLYFVLRLITIHAFFNFILFFFIKNNLSVITSTYHECETLYKIFTKKISFYLEKTPLTLT